MGDGGINFYIVVFQEDYCIGVEFGYVYEVGCNCFVGIVQGVGMIGKDELNFVFFQVRFNNFRFGEDQVVVFIRYRVVGEVNDQFFFVEGNVIFVFDKINECLFVFQVWFLEIFVSFSSIKYCLIYLCILMNVIGNGNDVGVVVDVFLYLVCCFVV